MEPLNMDYWRYISHEILSDLRKKDLKKACAKKKIKKRTKYYLGSTCEHKYLTQREAECVALFIVGDTMKMIGEKLGLSMRTVEFYLNNVKQKLGCQKKLELIDIIAKTEFQKAAIRLRLKLTHDKKSGPPRRQQQNQQDLQ